ncbi:putative e3 ubiquitin protein ligase [Acrodontium crateriforme]|uniref:HECT-type E3 ubiquitin transferase n=1 Tax=Acrodontium crateriforme TaxID=150365 RepID=A0AAQ3R6R9_9PEZI|nr:putative e3 ubiquitin protein ligase [Acrodontium crateriforme]
MHQSFTGNSRRPRQVNLSGRPSNPFGQSSTPGSGSHLAVASAQQDRLQRQQQRERAQASSCVQRVWRGHSSRRKTFATWRQIWDDQEKRIAQHGAYNSPEESLQQLNRLMLFFRPALDTTRLNWYGMRQMATNETNVCQGGPWPIAYRRIVRACTEALKARTIKDEQTDCTLLMILADAARRSELKKDQAVSYYETLTQAHEMPSVSLRDALLAPLQSSREAYAGLIYLLASPLETTMLSLLRSAVDPAALTQAFTSMAEKSLTSTRSRLWLLGNMLFLAEAPKDASSIEAVGRLLGSLADDVNFEFTPVKLANIAYDNDILAKVNSSLPLNTFLHDQISSLIKQDSIRNLLVRDGPTATNNAQLLAGYALTLLRCFPRRADDIRMWLYLGPTQSSTDLPATVYFWKAAKQSSVFTKIWQNSRAVLLLVNPSTPTSQLRDDWTLILVFLELYTFMLKIMDDEEFMGNGEHGRGNSAIPVNEVADLVTFLKNLGFPLYFDASSLNFEGDVKPRDAGASSLSRHFGQSSVEEVGEEVPQKKPLTVAGLPGLTIDYLKGVVTGLLRAIYERDSRRNFLPEDHWLMTSRFDMASFIPSVVLEEQNRHKVQKQDEDDQESQSDPDEEDDEEEDRRTGRRGYYSTASRLRGFHARAQRKAARKRLLETVAPRLEILQNMPFFIPFTTRVEIFRQFVELDQRRRRDGHVDPDMWRQNMMFDPSFSAARAERHHGKIRRKNEFSDAFEQFYGLGSDLKEPIQITFVDEYDMPEAGIDGGGVTKEFLTSVIVQAFNPDDPNMEQSFFVENDKHLLYPNPTAVEDLEARWRDMGVEESQVKTEVKTLLQQYEFLGRIIGKCLYESILVDVRFAGFFLKKWALTGGSSSAPMESGYRANINDLRDLDEELYRGLLAVKNAPANQIEDFGLTFTVDNAVGVGENKHVIEHELMPGGADMAVTSENRLIYINRMARYRLQTQSAHQSNAFLKGISSIIQPSWLSMFNQSELQTLVGGASADIDVQDLRRNTIYGGTYVIGDDGKEHPSVELFWEVMMKLPDQDRRSVLKFVTSTPRGPLLGFSQLHPRFSIRDSGSDEGRFPTTSTCVNLLKLPMYKTEAKMRGMLLAAVKSGAGFDLS